MKNTWNKRGIYRTVVMLALLAALRLGSGRVFASEFYADANAAPTAVAAQRASYDKEAAAKATPPGSAKNPSDTVSCHIQGAVEYGPGGVTQGPASLDRTATLPIGGASEQMPAPLRIDSGDLGVPGRFVNLTFHYYDFNQSAPYNLTVDVWQIVGDARRFHSSGINVQANGTSKHLEVDLHFPIDPVKDLTGYALTVTCGD